MRIKRSSDIPRSSPMTGEFIAASDLNLVVADGSLPDALDRRCGLGIVETMTTEPNRSEETEDEDAQVALATGRHGQQLVVSGWISSHADTGTPGPHLHLRTNDGDDAVLKTSQIPGLIEGLTLVSQRIDAIWETDGDDLLRTQFADAPDDNDPAMIHQKRIDGLEFVDRVAANLDEVIARIVTAEGMHEAMDQIGELLGVSPEQAYFRLSRFSLFGLTRAAQTHRTAKLRQLRSDGEPESRPST
jgi:hypothetical protein